MTQEQLREEYKRLTLLNSIEDSYDVIEIYLSYFFNVIMQNHHDPVTSQADAEAKLINQMIFTKTAYLKEIVKGIEYHSPDGGKMNRIIDPTIVACHLRNLYETIAMFNLIYVNTQSDDEKTILYNLWVSAGLKFRQRFESFTTQSQNRDKLEKEQQQIEQLKTEIESTELYKSLDERNQNKIQSKLKEKDYKIKFEGTEVNFLSWQDLSKTMGVKEGLMDHIYTYFSLYSHPSNVSVFQFADMFDKEKEPFLELTSFNLKYFFFLLSIFIGDYIKLFPSVLTTFEKLPLINQIVINAGNTLMRGYEDYSINDSWKALG